MESHDTIDESSNTLFQNHHCCFSFPCFSRNSWRKQQTTDTENTDSLWSRSFSVLMKIREWSELVAGPRWKTFIRQFNRNRSGNKHVNFQYDPLSYAMNFDEGFGQNGASSINEDEEYYRNFSSRYAKGSMDKDEYGPTFA